ncbi:hypothetical protein [Poritiphilus flavus]|uniref:Fibronectin type-III domain-containing protein n=1 Tax=Poritiphilus flavus TaxID=2697053 RepID=A0A6L9EIB7_9FLAO|nr:hypothetical protein [Poritiphilus flavus]NAS14405.1 hypothetical protein [Poritiphilus flavus]
MKIISRILIPFVLVSCGGGDSGGDGNPNPDPVPAPQAATLIFPDNNEECNEGENISGEESRVTFRWNASQNTDSYTVNLRNLNTNASSQASATTNEADVTIQRGTPYEWFVVSRASGTSETATSATWRFYNQGPGLENYAPFPALAVNPARGSTINASGMLTLEWEGNDVDDDIVEYEVFFGTDSNPETLLATTAETTQEVAVTTSQVYYWRVLTRDSQGNTSQSEIFEFRIE